MAAVSPSKLLQMYRQMTCELACSLRQQQEQFYNHGAGGPTGGPTPTPNAFSSPTPVLASPPMPSSAGSSSSGGSSSAGRANAFSISPPPDDNYIRSCAGAGQGEGQGHNHNYNYPPPLGAATAHDHAQQQHAATADAGGGSVSTSASTTSAGARNTSGPTLGDRKLRDMLQKIDGQLANHASMFIQYMEAVLTKMHDQDPTKAQDRIDADPTSGEADRDSSSDHSELEAEFMEDCLVSAPCDVRERRILDSSCVSQSSSRSLSEKTRPSIAHTTPTCAASYNYNASSATSSATTAAVATSSPSPALTTPDVGKPPLLPSSLIGGVGERTPFGGGRGSARGTPTAGSSSASRRGGGSYGGTSRKRSSLTPSGRPLQRASVASLANFLRPSSEIWSSEKLLPQEELQESDVHLVEEVLGSLLDLSRISDHITFAGSELLAGGSDAGGSELEFGAGGGGGEPIDGGAEQIFLRPSGDASSTSLNTQMVSCVLEASPDGRREAGENLQADGPSGSTSVVGVFAAEDEGRGGAEPETAIEVEVEAASDVLVSCPESGKPEYRIESGEQEPRTSQAPAVETVEDPTLRLQTSPALQNEHSFLVVESSRPAAAEGLCSDSRLGTPVLAARAGSFGFVDAPHGDEHLRVSMTAGRSSGVLFGERSPSPFSSHEGSVRRSKMDVGFLQMTEDTKAVLREEGSLAAQVEQELKAVSSAATTSTRDHPEETAATEFHVEDSASGAPVAAAAAETVLRASLEHEMLREEAGSDMCSEALDLTTLSAGTATTKVVVAGSFRHVVGAQSLPAPRTTADESEELGACTSSAGRNLRYISHSLPPRIDDDDDDGDDCIPSRTPPTEEIAHMLHNSNHYCDHEMTSDLNMIDVVEFAGAVTTLHHGEQTPQHASVKSSFNAMLDEADDLKLINPLGGSADLELKNSYASFAGDYNDYELHGADQSDQAPLGGVFPGAGSGGKLKLTCEEAYLKTMQPFANLIDEDTNSSNNGSDHLLSDELDLESPMTGPRLGRGGSCSSSSACPSESGSCCHQQPLREYDRLPEIATTDPEDQAYGGGQESGEDGDADINSACGPPSRSPPRTLLHGVGPIGRPGLLDDGVRSSCSSLGSVPRRKVRSGGVTTGRVVVAQAHEERNSLLQQQKGEHPGCTRYAPTLLECPLEDDFPEKKRPLPFGDLLGARAAASASNSSSAASSSHSGDGVRSPARDEVEVTLAEDEEDDYEKHDVALLHSAEPEQNVRIQKSFSSEQGQSTSPGSTLLTSAAASSSGRKSRILLPKSRSGSQQRGVSRAPSGDTDSEKQLIAEQQPAGESNPVPAALKNFDVRQSMTWSRLSSKALESSDSLSFPREDVDDDPPHASPSPSGPSPGSTIAPSPELPRSESDDNQNDKENNSSPEVFTPDARLPSFNGTSAPPCTLRELRLNTPNSPPPFHSVPSSSSVGGFRCGGLGLLVARSSGSLTGTMRGLTDLEELQKSTASTMGGLGGECCDHEGSQEQVQVVKINGEEFFRQSRSSRVNIGGHRYGRMETLEEVSQESEASSSQSPPSWKGSCTGSSGGKDEDFYEEADPEAPRTEAHGAEVEEGEATPADEGACASSCDTIEACSDERQQEEEAPSDGLPSDAAQTKSFRSSDELLLPAAPAEYLDAEVAAHSPNASAPGPESVNADPHAHCSAALLSAKSSSGLNIFPEQKQTSTSPQCGPTAREPLAPAATEQAEKSSACTPPPPSAANFVMLPKCVTESAAVERNTRYAHVERSHETQSSSTEGNCLYSSCHYEDGLELWMRNEISGSTVVIDAEGRSGGGRARGGAASKSRSRSRGAAGGAPRHAATSISHGAGAEVEDYSFLLEWEQLTAAEIAEIKHRQRTKFVKCSVIAVSDELVIYKNVVVRERGVIDLGGPSSSSCRSTSSTTTTTTSTSARRSRSRTRSTSLVKEDGTTFKETGKDAEEIAAPTPQAEEPTGLNPTEEVLEPAKKYPAESAVVAHEEEVEGEAGVEVDTQASQPDGSADRHRSSSQLFASPSPELSSPPPCCGASACCSSPPPAENAAVQPGPQATPVAKGNLHLAPPVAEDVTRISAAFRRSSAAGARMSLISSISSSKCTSTPLKAVDVDASHRSDHDNSLDRSDEDLVMLHQAEGGVTPKCSAEKNCSKGKQNANSSEDGVAAVAGSGPGKAVVPSAASRMKIVRIRTRTASLGSCVSGASSCDVSVSEAGAAQGEEKLEQDEQRAPTSDESVRDAAASDPPEVIAVDIATAPANSSVASGGLDTARGPRPTLDISADEVQSASPVVADTTSTAEAASASSQNLHLVSQASPKNGSSSSSNSISNQQHLEQDSSLCNCLTGSRNEESRQLDVEDASQEGGVGFDLVHCDSGDDIDIIIDEVDEHEPSRCPTDGDAPPASVACNEHGVVASDEGEGSENEVKQELQATCSPRTNKCADERGARCGVAAPLPQQESIVSAAVEERQRQIERGDLEKAAPSRGPTDCRETRTTERSAASGQHDYTAEADLDLQDLVEKKEESSQVIPEEAAAIPEQVDEEDDVDMNGEMYCTTPTTRGGSCATFHRNYPGGKNDLPDPDAPGFGPSARQQMESGADHGSSIAARSSSDENCLDVSPPLKVFRNSRDSRVRPEVKGLNKENVNSYANYKPKRRLQLGPRQSQIGINVDAVEKSALHPNSTSMLSSIAPHGSLLGRSFAASSSFAAPEHSLCYSETFLGSPMHTGGRNEIALSALHASQAYPPGASRVAHQHHFGGHQNQIVAGQEPGLRKQLQPFPRQRDFSQQSGPQAHQDRLSRLSSFLSSSGDHDDSQRPDGSRSSAFSPLDSVDYSPTPRGTRREPELLLPPQDVGSTPPKQAQPTTGAVDEEAKNGTEKLSGCEVEVRWGDHEPAADRVVGQLRGEEAVSVAGPRSEGGSGCTTTEADRLLRTMGNRDGFVPVRGRVKSLREQQQDLRREGSRRGLRGEDSEIGASRDWTNGHPLHGGAVAGLQDEFDDLLKKTDAERGQSASDIRASLSDFLSNPEVVMEATVKVAMASTKSK